MLLSLTLSVKREPNQEAKFSICRSIPALTFTYGHELLVVTEKKSEVVDTRGQHEFPPRVKEETQGEELDIQRKLGAEPLQRWARASDCDRRIPLEAFQTRSTTRRP